MVNEVAARHSGTLFGRAQVDVNFRARATGACIAHFPEIVFLVTVDDVIFGEVFFPNSGGFVITSETVVIRAFKYCCIKIFGVEFQHINEIFPSPIDCLLFEVIAKRPVTEHFKHGVVICIHTHFFQVIVLTAYAQTLLRVGNTLIFCRGITEDNILKLVHTGICKHQCGVIFDNHRSRRYNLVAFATEEFLERLTNFFCCQHFLIYFVWFIITL